MHAVYNPLRRRFSYSVLDHFKIRIPTKECQPWLGIPHCVLKSEAFRQLSSIAKLLLVSITLRFNGFNNGKISVSYRQFAEDLNRKNQGPFAAAIAELVQHGLIEVMIEGAWISRKARQYRLTFVSTGSEWRPIAATNEYVHWRPDRDRKKFRPTNGVAKLGASAAPAGARLGSACYDPSSKQTGKPAVEGKNAATASVANIFIHPTAKRRQRNDRLG